MRKQCGSKRRADRVWRSSKSEDVCTSSEPKATRPGAKRTGPRHMRRCRQASGPRIAFRAKRQDHRNSPSGQIRCVNGAVVLGGGSTYQARLRPAGYAVVFEEAGVADGILASGNGRGVVADGLPVQRRTIYEPRCGEGLKSQRSELRPVAPLITADRRESPCTARIQPGINSILESREATAIKQTASHCDQSGYGSVWPLTVPPEGNERSESGVVW